VVGFRTLTVDLRHSGAVFLQVAGGGHGLTRVIFLSEPAIVYRRLAIRTRCRLASTWRTVSASAGRRCGLPRLEIERRGGTWGSWDRME
jgi:hypothetical protein